MPQLPLFFKTYFGWFTYYKELGYCYNKIMIDYKKKITKFRKLSGFLQEITLVLKKNILLQ